MYKSLLITVFSFVALDLSAQVLTINSYEKKIRNLYGASTIVEKLPRKDLEQSVRSFLSNGRPNRLVGSVGHKGSHDFLISELEKMKGENISLEKQEFDLPASLILKYNLKTQKGKNIIWEKKGIEKPNDILVITAHFDTLTKDYDPKKKDAEKTYMPGADNNATGVSALINLAKILGGLDLPKTVRIVFLDAEELENSGSLAYAKKIKADNVYAVMSVAMLGHDSKLTDKNKKLNNFKLYSGNAKSEVAAKALNEAALKSYRVIQFEESLIPQTNPFASHLKNFTDIGTSALLFSGDLENDLNPRFLTGNDFAETLNYQVYYNAFRYFSLAVVAWNYDIVK